MTEDKIFEIYYLIEQKKKVNHLLTANVVMNLKNY